MPESARRGALRPRRRRRDDEGEEEGSVIGDLDDFSMSEGSAISNLEDDADVEGSDVSAEDDLSIAPSEPNKPMTGNGNTRHHLTRTANGRPEFGSFKPSPETEAMRNGLRVPKMSDQELHNGNIMQEGESQPVAEHDLASLQEQSETAVPKSKREHLDYVKQRDSDAAFVPNRGRFFLHDDRSLSTNSPFSQPYQRGRGRGYGPGYGPGRGYLSVAEPTNRQWAHDLHETVNKAAPQSSSRGTPSSLQIPTAKPATHPPNRTFSVTTVLGNVAVQMSLPGMEEKKIFPSVTKKQYTLLPQHRPPLRRDKPVRISIPDEPPRFIFPSTERSFIFIPRALRPNQQSFTRGRGRGSFHGSRRTSMLGGSMYTPSIGMSRKSSVSGVLTNGIHTPTDSMMRGNLYPMNIPRPVVRMPVAPMPMSMPMQMPMPMSMHGLPFGLMSAGPQTPTIPDHGGPGPAILQSPLTTLPMHQPRPQKAVSIAEIESPHFKAPQQQQEQPFHQQVPANVAGHEGQAPPVGTVMGDNTPLSHIPEGAVYAQPFQPYTTYPQGNYYGFQYNGPPMYYQPTPDGMNYVPMNGPVMAPQFIGNAAPVNFTSQPSGNYGTRPSVAHETNGTVYYYNQVQYPMDGSMNHYQSGNMMPTDPFYYTAMPSQGMYYPPPTGQ